MLTDRSSSGPSGESRYHAHSVFETVDESFWEPASPTSPLVFSPRRSVCLPSPSTFVEASRGRRCYSGSGSLRAYTACVSSVGRQPSA